MKPLLHLGLLLLLGACASTPQPAETASLERALRADLFGGGSIDLNHNLAEGRRLALVFWQSW